MVDADAVVSLIGTGLVIPERVQSRLIVAGADRIAEAQVQEFAKLRPAFGLEERVVPPSRRIGRVLRLRDHVVVAAKDERLFQREELRRAVAADDLAALTKVPGIGKKGAQRIVLELKDRIGAAGSADSSRASTPASGRGGEWRDQVHQALLGLGWPTRDAESAVDAVADQAGDTPDVSVLLRAALRTLAKS
jgi:hypothetical protein